MYNTVRRLKLQWKLDINQFSCVMLTCPIKFHFRLSRVLHVGPTPLALSTCHDLRDLAGLHGSMPSALQVGHGT